MALPPARHPAIALILVAVLTAILAWVVLTVTADTREAERQDALAPFYLPPDPLPDEPPGTILRREPLGVQVKGGRALRILYMSERGDGQPRAASGMLFIPNGPAPASGRPVVAWAHGTIGLGDQCAPSRQQDPLPKIPWVEEMMAQGWVVAATDYAGLGTPGTSGYLISAEESRDVINSVRAAREAPRTGAGARWIAWGHSQGGHSALAAGRLAPAYAPELDLLGVATAAPAAELPLLMDLEWDSTNAWVIGSDVAGTWPDFYPQLDRAAVLTTNGENHWQSMLEKCLTQAAYAALFRQEVLGQDFFRVSPLEVPAWRSRIAQNTAVPLPTSVPLFVAQSTSDQVVLPPTTATLVRDWCARGSRINTMWIADVSHQQTAITVGPSAVQWMDQVFRGGTTPDDCGLPLPVAPASRPAG
ncbi:MAG: alpha/beta hydrolase [Thermoleophilia bacterium]|nr:alpha/beta hydrolase [Thermoleophilia bacterium]